MKKESKTVKSQLAGVEDDDLDRLELEVRALIARGQNTPIGYANFYHVIFGRPIPRHALDEWVKPIYAAWEKGKGMVIEAFRGSGKTTTVTIGLVAFRIGHAPHKSNILIQVSNASAKDTCRQIADMIAHNPGWQMVFPDVVPDKKATWAEKGYEVKRINVDYAEWRKYCARNKSKDPTLVGWGYKSWAIIGRHPTGLLVVDDIHDENNTRSAVELAKVKKILQGTIFPTLTPKTRSIFIGTPWTENDVLAYVKSSGRFRSVKTPVMRTKGDKKVLTWKQVFNLAEIKKQRQLAGELEFARMFMLDLKAIEGIHLKREWLHAYPLEKIDPGWPVVMGVDYASTADQMQAGKRDYFAVAIGRTLPGGAGVVLVDGFRGKVSQGEAEQRLKTLAEIYPTTQLIGVEAVGKGEEFYHLMLRTSRLPIVSLHTGRKSKGERFQKGMAPLFEFSRAWIANIETPFLRAFRAEWVSWPYAEHDDTLDAVYWMLYAARNHLEGAGRRTKKHVENPFGALGRG